MDIHNKYINNTAYRKKSIKKAMALASVDSGDWVCTFTR